MLKHGRSIGLSATCVFSFLSVPAAETSLTAPAGHRETALTQPEPWEKHSSTAVSIDAKSLTVLGQFNPPRTPIAVSEQTYSQDIRRFLGPLETALKNINPDPAKVSQLKAALKTETLPQLIVWSVDGQAAFTRYAHADGKTQFTSSVFSKDGLIRELPAASGITNPMVVGFAGQTIIGLAFEKDARRLVSWKFENDAWSMKVPGTIPAYNTDVGGCYDSGVVCGTMYDHEIAKPYFASLTSESPSVTFLESKKELARVIAVDADTLAATGEFYDKELPHAAFWKKDRKIVEIELPGESTYSRAFGIRSDGVIVGTYGASYPAPSVKSREYGPLNLFCTEQGCKASLPGGSYLWTLKESATIAVSWNKIRHGFLYSPELGFVDLNTALPSELKPDLRITDAFSLNPEGTLLFTGLYKGENVEGSLKLRITPANKK